MMVLKMKRGIEHISRYICIHIYIERVYVYSLFSEESASPCHVINY